jgi:hypothetical protein
MINRASPGFLNVATEIGKFDFVWLGSWSKHVENVTQPSQSVHNHGETSDEGNRWEVPVDRALGCRVKL